MGERERRKAETRRRIVEAARDAFEEEGYEAPVRSIARRAGVAAGTLFVHFADKPALLAAVIKADLEEALAEAWLSLPEAAIGEQLLHLAGALYRSYARRPGLSRVLLKESLFPEGGAGESMAEQTHRFARALAELFRGAIEVGEVPRGLTAEDGASLFLGLYLGTLVAGLRGEAGPAAEDWLGVLRRMLTHALGAKAFASGVGGGS